MPGCDPFTENQMISILESKAFGIGSRSRNQCLFVLECCTGGRISELLKLKRGDVLDEFGRLRKKIVFTKTKNKHSREVELINPLIGPYIYKWLEGLWNKGYSMRSGYFFPSPRSGQAISRQQIYKIYKKAAIELKLEGRFGTHSCRKTWARDTYKYYHSRQIAGELIDPLLKLMQAGGWIRLDSVKHYLNFMLGDTTESQVSLFPKVLGYAKQKKERLERVFI